MRPLTTLVAVVVTIGLTVPSYANPSLVDDSDLSNPAAAAKSLERLEQEARAEPDAWVFPVQSAQSATVAKTVLAKTGKLSRVKLDGGAWTSADAEGRIELPISAGAHTLRISLDNAFWNFKGKNDKSYEWELAFTAGEGGVDLGEVSPKPGSESASVALLHRTFLEAKDFLGREGDHDWWTRSLRVNWPSNSDHFSPWAFSIDLSNAQAWDVVLHELGHAVMHGSMQARSAGGSHKIDECYSEALAWSEGWASYFAASVRLSRDAADARFEYLVPRRAPIRLENVPADVCNGPKNEWRVAAGLWDLLDRHPDGGDAVALSFAETWKPLRGKAMGSVGEAWALMSTGLTPEQKAAGNAALIHNTVHASAPAIALRLPLLPEGWASPR